MIHKENQLIVNLLVIGVSLIALSLVACLAGFFFKSGDILVLGFLCCAFSVGYAFAIRGFLMLKPKGLEWGLLINYSAYSAIAVYMGLCYLFWMLGWPLSIQAVKNFTMGQTYYASPVAIVIALISYLILISSVNNRRK